MTTLKGLWPTATAAQRGRNPVGVVKHRVSLPRVARPSQPWALLRNPFGILPRNVCRVPGTSFRGGWVAYVGCYNLNPPSDSIRLIRLTDRIIFVATQSQLP